MTSTGNAQQEYRYFAFISYSRRDQQWAQWLQRRLESYHLPTRIVRKYEGVPKRITPIFRDETDLAGVVLAESLERSLRESQYLIVIASPNSAGSEWVGKEIEAFRAMGREDHIIPFIVEGVPFSEDAAEECFHEQLRTIEPVLMGVSTQELGRRRAFLRLVATMFHLEYDELLMRDQRRRVRNGVLLAVAVLVLLAGIFAAVWYNTEHTAWYRSYVTQREVPVGVDRLSRAERAGMNVCYRFTTLRGKVIRVECVDSYGNVTAPMQTFTDTDYPRLDYLYDNAGTLVRIEQRYATGALASQKVLTHENNRIAIDYRKPGDTFTSQAIAADQSYAIFAAADSERSEIIRQINTYDDRGLLVKVMYYRDTLGTPACDANGIYGKCYAYDDQNCLISVTSLNERGEVYNCKYGWATVCYEYNAQSFVAREAYYNAAGEPVNNHNGIFVETAEYDMHGNVLSSILYDREGARTSNGAGVSMVRYAYDDRGLLLSERFYGTEDEPVEDSSGVHEICLEYDPQGRLAAEAFFDTQGNPVNTSDKNCARIAYEYDENGRKSFERFFDAEGNLCCSAFNGVYATGYTYDEYGYYSSISGYDAEGSPMAFRYGYARICIRNTAEGRYLRLEYRDEAGNLVLGKGSYAVDVRSYDQYGNLASIRYYGVNEEPWCSADGYHGVDYVYEDGRIVSSSFVGADGQPTVCKDYYHAQHIEYDGHGNRISQKLLDAYGNMIENREGYAEIRQVYDEYGRVLEESFHDRFGNLSGANGEYYRFRFTYDGAGNVAKQECWGYDGETQTEYHHIYTCEYDASGRVIFTACYDSPEALTAGEPVYRVYTTYDRQHRVIREDMVYPSVGETMSLRYTYDAHGYMTGETCTWTDAQGNETQQYARRYERDRLGNCLRTENLGPDGALADSEDGYAVIVRQFTPEGYCSVQEYYDAAGNPVMVGDSFRTEMKYDAAGNVIEERYYGADRQPLPESEGHSAVAVMAYDSRGNMVYKALLNENGEPCRFAADGSSSAGRYYYSPMDTLLYYELLDADGGVISVWRAVALVGTVVEGSYGESLGIRPGDIVLKYGDWCYFDCLDPDVELGAEIRRLRFAGKTLILGRMEAEGCRIIPIEASEPIMMGIGVYNEWIAETGVELVQAAWQAEQGK